MPDKMEGKAKEAYGALKGDESKKAEGQAQQEAGEAQQESKTAKEQEKARNAKGENSGGLLGGKGLL